MAHEPRTIVVEPGSELDRLLAEVNEEPVVLLRNGSRYRLNRLDPGETDSEDIWVGYDPEKAIAGMRAAAGAWSDVDPDELTDYIYRGRIEGSRPLDRP